MGLPELSSDGQFFIGAQTAVSVYPHRQLAAFLLLPLAMLTP